MKLVFKYIIRSFAMCSAGGGGFSVLLACISQPDSNGIKNINISLFLAANYIHIYIRTPVQVPSFP